MTDSPRAVRVATAISGKGNNQMIRRTLIGAVGAGLIAVLIWELSALHLH